MLQKFTGGHYWIGSWEDPHQESRYLDEIVEFKNDSGEWTLLDRMREVEGCCGSCHCVDGYCSSCCSVREYFALSSVNFADIEPYCVVDSSGAVYIHSQLGLSGLIMILFSYML